jgi:hypothetical protein
MDFVTIFTAFKLDEAQLVHSRLEAAGFHPFVADENSALPISSIFVQVPEAEAADVREFLEAK